MPARGRPVADAPDGYRAAGLARGGRVGPRVADAAAYRDADVRRPGGLDGMAAGRMSTVSLLIEQWQEARRLLAEIEQAEHPDVTDGYGRVWRWRGRGDLYVHDDALAFPLHV